MDARYSRRKALLLEECQVAPEVFERVIPRLHTFLEPFVATLHGQAPRAHAQTYVRGLLSDVERKNVASIAYHFGQERLGLQGFIGWSDWDEPPCARHCAVEWARNWDKRMAGSCLIPRRFQSPGKGSVGVARQWCGRLGKVDNCQVAIDLGYVSRKGHTLVDLRLSLPKEWIQDKARLDKAGVPRARRGYHTRHQ